MLDDPPLLEAPPVDFEPPVAGTPPVAVVPPLLDVPPAVEPPPLVEPPVAEDTDGVPEQPVKNVALRTSARQKGRDCFMLTAYH